MALNSGAVRVAGTGSIWKAPLGTTLPSDSTTAWGTGFVNLGYATDGFTVTQDLKKQDITAWQTLTPVRSLATALIRKLTFEALESNINTVPLAWGGATMTPGLAGIYTLAIPDGALTDFILGVDWSDGTTSQRIIVKQASLLTLPAIKFVRTDAIRYPLEVQAIAPADGTASIVVYGVDSIVSGV